MLRRRLLLWIAGGAANLLAEGVRACACDIKPENNVEVVSAAMGGVVDAALPGSPTDRTVSCYGKAFVVERVMLRRVG